MSGEGIPAGYCLWCEQGDEHCHGLAVEHWTGVDDECGDGLCNGAGLHIAYASCSMFEGTCPECG